MWILKKKKKPGSSNLNMKFLKNKSWTLYYLCTRSIGILTNRCVFEHFWFIGYLVLLKTYALLFFRYLGIIKMLYLMEFDAEHLQTWIRNNTTTRHAENSRLWCSANFWSNIWQPGTLSEIYYNLEAISISYQKMLLRITFSDT